MSERRRGRRRVLAALCGIGASGLGGCLTAVGPAAKGGDGPTKLRTTGQSIPSFGVESSKNGIVGTPMAATVQSAVVHRTGDGLAVTTTGDRQVVFVEIDLELHATVDDVQPDRFRLDLGKTTVEGQSSFPEVTGEVVHQSFAGAFTGVPQVRTEKVRRAGWVGFPVPAGTTVEEGRLRLNPAEPNRGTLEWHVPDRVERLVGPPAADLAVTGVDAPGTVPADPAADAAATLTVENRGDGAGRLPFVVDRVGGGAGGSAAGAAMGDVLVPAGSTDTARVPLPLPEEPVSATFAVVTANDERSVTVAVE